MLRKHGYNNGYMTIRRLLHRHKCRPETEPHGIAVEGGLEPKPLTGWKQDWLDQSHKTQEEHLTALMCYNAHPLITYMEI